MDTISADGEKGWYVDDILAGEEVVLYIDDDVAGGEEWGWFISRWYCWWWWGGKVEVNDTQNLTALPGVTVRITVKLTTDPRPAKLSTE